MLHGRAVRERRQTGRLAGVAGASALPLFVAAWAVRFQLWPRPSGGRRRGAGASAAVAVPLEDAPRHGEEEQGGHEADDEASDDPTLRRGVIL